VPITPTYPGLYLEELPSNAHTITAAPTSITVFVGYSHPYKTQAFDTAVELFSFADYERRFGGLFASGVFDSNLAYAVNQFFLNGGSIAYVIGLKPAYRDAAGTVIGTQPPAPPSVAIGTITFAAREPTDRQDLRVTTEQKGATTDLGDITITYGSAIETYRGVSNDPTSARYVEKILGTPSNPISELVTVQSTGGVMPTQAATAIAPNLPATLDSTFSIADFSAVFDADSSLDKVEIFNLLCVPGIVDATVLSTALAFAERKLAFVIVDSPGQAIADSGQTNSIDALIGNIPKSTNGALYFPYLRVTDPMTQNPRELPASGFVAGKYADTDVKRGVWKAPAGLATTISTTTGVAGSGRMNNPRQGVLNPMGVNCLRTFRDSGTVIFGARTLVTANPAFQQWRYVPVRRTALFIEQTLMNNLGWAVFEPNDRPLWTALRDSVNDFMLGLFNQHAFQGDTPSQAFKVVCDETTTTQADIDNGIVNIIVAFRPLKPAEFVIIKIAQLAGQPKS
jgi:phage tail sheath protein FI